MRKTASGCLQKLRETAGLLPALARGQYFSFGFGVFGLYLSQQTRLGALKIARNLQRLRRVPIVAHLKTKPARHYCWLITPRLIYR